MGWVFNKSFWRAGKDIIPNVYLWQLRTSEKINTWGWMGNHEWMIRLGLWEAPTAERDINTSLHNCIKALRIIIFTACRNEWILSFTLGVYHWVLVEHFSCIHWWIYEWPTNNINFINEMKLSFNRLLYLLIHNICRKHSSLQNKISCSLYILDLPNFID